MRRVVTALTVGLLLASVVGASAPIFVAQSLERYFRVQWRVTRDRKGPAVESYRVQVLSFDWACNGGGGGM